MTNRELVEVLRVVYLESRIVFATRAKAADVLQSLISTHYGAQRPSRHEGGATVRLQHQDSIHALH